MSSWECFISTVSIVSIKSIYDFSKLVLSSFLNVGLEDSDFSSSSASVDFSLTLLLDPDMLLRNVRLSPNYFI